MPTKPLFLCAALVVTGAGLTAFAPDAMARSGPIVVVAPRADTDVPTRRVSYADLNLASMSGQNTLNSRVGYAVNSVCTESNLSFDYYHMHNCKNFAWSGARPQIDRAVQRAREIAATGSSSIAAAAITLTFPK